MLSVIIDVSVELAHSAVVNDIESIAESTQEVLVMRYDDESSFVVVESNDEGVDGVKVQMVCRLIQQEDVWLLPGDDGEGDTGFLSS